MDAIPIELPRPKHSIWDNEVPIITEKNITRVYLNDDIGHPAMYNELCYKLHSASEAETFFIYINTPGGMLDAAVMIVNALQSTDANTVAILSGTVASAGTIIALSCKDLIAQPHLSFMCHNYSGGMIGKGHEMKAQQSFNDKELPKAFNTFYKGFMIPTEIEEMIDGKDFWFSTEEVQKRWKNRQTAVSDDDYGTEEI